MLRQECKRVAAVSATPRSSPPSRRQSWRSPATALAATPLFRNSPLPFLRMSQSARVLVLLYYLAPRSFNPPAPPLQSLRTSL